MHCRFRAGFECSIAGVNTLGYAGTAGSRMRVARIRLPALLCLQAPAPKATRFSVQRRRMRSHRCVGGFTARGPRASVSIRDGLPVASISRKEVGSLRRIQS